MAGYILHLHVLGSSPDCRMDRKKLEFSSGGNKLMPSVAGGLMQVGPNPDAWKEKKMAQVGFWYVAGGKK